MPNQTGDEDFLVTIPCRFALGFSASGPASIIARNDHVQEHQDVGFTSPSRANQAAFDRAVEVSGAAGMAADRPSLGRRALGQGLCFAALLAGSRPAWAQAGAASLHAPDKRWYDAAAAMRRLAESWGDQPYGAVLVLRDAVVGNGPSRVVQRGDATAHAEREAIRDAQRRLGRKRLSGSVLYATSRPCPACEAAAAEAGVARMFFGEDLRDAGRLRGDAQ